jgi:hypothetical protein
MNKLVLAKLTTAAMAVGGLLAIGAGAAAASPATGQSPEGQTAGTENARMSEDCLQIGLTSRAGNTIKGYGSISGCTGRATIEIWRSRFGGWETVSSTTVQRPGYDQTVFYDCAGTGTHTFKTVIMAKKLSGQIISKSSNQIRESC